MPNVNLNSISNSLTKKMLIGALILLSQQELAIGQEAIRIPYQGNVYNDGQDIHGKKIKTLQEIIVDDTKALRPGYLGEPSTGTGNWNRGGLLPSLPSTLLDAPCLNSQAVENPKLNQKKYALLINNAVNVFEFIEVYGNGKTSDPKILSKNDIHILVNNDEPNGENVIFKIKFRANGQDMTHTIQEGEVKMLSLKGSSFEFRSSSRIAIR